MLHKHPKALPMPWHPGLGLRVSAPDFRGAGLRRGMMKAGAGDGILSCHWHSSSQGTVLALGGTKNQIIDFKFQWSYNSAEMVFLEVKVFDLPEEYFCNTEG